jgi:hypothetical protein
VPDPGRARKNPVSKRGELETGVLAANPGFLWVGEKSTGRQDKKKSGFEEKTQFQRKADPNPLSSCSYVLCEVKTPTRGGVFDHALTRKWQNSV